MNLLFAPPPSSIESQINISDLAIIISCHILSNCSHSSHHVNTVQSLLNKSVMSNHLWCALEGSITCVLLFSVHWKVLLQAFYRSVCTGRFCCRRFIVQCALECSTAGVLLFSVHEDREWLVTLIMGRW